MSEHVVPTNTASGLRPAASPAVSGLGSDNWDGSWLPRLRRVPWRLYSIVFIGCLAAVADGLLANGSRGAGPAWLRAAIVSGLVAAGALAFTIRGRERMGL